MASAARARPGPMSAARSAPGEPAGSSPTEPSGRGTRIAALVLDDPHGLALVGGAHGQAPRRGWCAALVVSKTTALRDEFPVLQRVASLTAGTEGPIPRAATELAQHELAA